MAALAVAATAEVEFGGVVSVGGRLPSASRSAAQGKGKGKSKTPVVLLGGSRSVEVTSSAVTTVRDAFTDVEYVKWAKSEVRKQAVPLSLHLTPLHPSSFIPHPHSTSHSHSHRKSSCAPKKKKRVLITNASRIPCPEAERRCYPS
jgi:hypothetical protein